MVAEDVDLLDDAAFPGRAPAGGQVGDAVDVVRVVGQAGSSGWSLARTPRNPAVSRAVCIPSLLDVQVGVTGGALY